MIRALSPASYRRLMSRVVLLLFYGLTFSLALNKSTVLEDRSLTHSLLRLTS